MGISTSGRRGFRHLGLSLGAAVALCGGCQKHGAKQVDAADPGPQTSGDLYRAGRYAEAKGRAAAEFKQLNGGHAKRTAALTAGLAAHANGNTAEARGWLEPLLDDADPAIAGRAGAAVGMIVDKQGDHRRGAELLSAAADKLQDDESARARLRAGHAYSAAGRNGEALASYQAALATAKSPKLQDAIRPFTAPGPFSLQIGVFSSRPNAEQRATEVGQDAARLGLGATRVVPTAGKPGYSVRVGTFASRHAAITASSKLPTKSVVVAAN